MKPQVFVIMGVSGSGKSTIGGQLAEAIGGRFFDGDDFHPPENVAKMASGSPLDDEDRRGWLEKLAELIEAADQHTVIACSALKQSYREVLAGAEFIFLNGPRAVIESRLQKRKDHYMPPSLLDSQLADLEPPEQALVIDLCKTPEELVCKIRTHFEL
ncbi:MAG: gluconokinase [Akkermansiaceae bacterium]